MSKLEENQQLLKFLEKQEKQLLTEFMNSDVCQYPDLGCQLQSAIRDIKRQKLEVCEVINQLIAVQERVA